MEFIITIIKFVIISTFIQLSLASILTLTGKTKNRNKGSSNLSFDELFLDYSDIPNTQKYTARDEALLDYREYEANSNKVIILLHGSGWHSQYFLPLAKHLSHTNTAWVYTPDLRGHGKSPSKRGDINYIDQLEDDLEDFIKFVKTIHADKEIIIAGHSSGGGLVIRFAGSIYGNIADGYLLLSPFLKYNAPTMRKNSGGWAFPYTPRIIGLSIFNTLGIHWFDFLPAIEFDMPDNAKDGTETLSYSFRLNTGYAPRNYKKDLSKINVPLLLMAGSEDESFYPLQFEPEISKYTDADFKIVENTGHMGIVLKEEAFINIEQWLKHL